MKRNTAFTLLLLLLLPLTARADQVDTFVRGFMAERHIPGAAVAVVHKGKVMKVQGYGLASLEHNVPVTRDTVFEIGSVSKQMTAAGIMLLVEDGKVSLDERISAYLAGTPEAWKDVTVRHLLTHTSGIKSYSSLDGFELIKRQTAADFIRKLSAHPLEFIPGERNVYSNSGFTLLAYIIESRSGKPFIEFMRERIFRPLGMSKTSDRDPEYVIPNRAAGYEWRGDRYAGRSWDLTDLKGAGSIVSTIGDMVKWNAALSGDSFLKPASKAEIWKQFALTGGEMSIYGLGWRISDVRGHKLIGHTGQTAGFTAANYRYPDHSLAVVVLTNTGETGNAGLMAANIAKKYVPSMSLIVIKPLEADNERLLRVKAAIRSVLTGAPNEALMTRGLIDSLGTARSKRMIERLSAGGPIDPLVLVGTNNAGERIEERYRGQNRRGVYLWSVAFDNEGRLDRLNLEEEEY